VHHTGGGTARAACAGLGAGFGMGSSYSDCQREVRVCGSFAPVGLSTAVILTYGPSL
jgi:hypothetical protein